MRVACHICDKEYGGVQALENHLLYTKKRCYEGLLELLPPNFDRFCAQHGRVCAGVGVPNGAEAIIHSIAHAMENLQEDESILQVDFTNAFNLTSRQKFIDLTYDLLPKIANLTNFLYSSKGLLKLGHNGDDFLLSCTGVQQGCPLAPLLFALVLRELTTKISNTFPDLKLNVVFG